MLVNRMYPFKLITLVNPIWNIKK